MPKDFAQEVATDISDDVETTVDQAQPETEAAPEISTLTQEQYDELNNRYVRMLADFDNFKRRSQGEKDDIYKYGNSKLVGELLPVLDNFELAFKNATDHPEAAGFIEGIDMVYKQLMKVLEEAGLEKIPALGQPFDPVYHEAVMMVPDESVPAETIIDELRSGYVFKDKVIRPTVCRVAQG